jgi:phosphoserine phosphatase
MILNQEGKPTFGTTIICRYNELDVEGELRNMLESGLIPGSVYSSFLEKGKNVETPVDIAELGEHGMYDLNEIGRDGLIEIKARLNKGLTEEEMNRALEEMRFTEGVEEFVQWAKNNGMKQMVITDSWDPVAQFIKGNFGLDYAEGVKPCIKEGRYTGKVEKIEKEPIINRVLKNFGVNDDRVVAIDDAQPYIARFGLPIVFCPRNKSKFEGLDVSYVDEPNFHIVKDLVEEWILNLGD